MPEVVRSEASMLWNHTGSWRYMKPRYLDKTPPCNQGCPAGNDIEAFVRLIGEGKFVEAWRLIKEESPFPKVCGRVCFSPCETACNRDQFDHPTSINSLERFAADQAPANEKPKKLREDSGKTVAVVGAGPAGLTAAYHLARMGHSVTVFESRKKPGGLLRYGIPQYRLPKDILDMEIDDIKSLGVDIQCSKTVGLEAPFKELEKFDAIFVASGVHAGRKLGIDFEEADGVLAGLEFLGAVAENKAPDLGEKTVIIGGGNTAIDAARCALRLGSQATIFYHRSRVEMPAFEQEISEAEKEGVTIKLLTQPLKVITLNGKATGMQMGKTELGAPDESGRRRPVPVEGSEFTVSADTIITAIGESADLDYLPKDVQIESGRVAIDKFGISSLPGVFAGGDAALRVHNVTTAIGSGKWAACAIDCYLKGEKFEDIAHKVTIGEKGAVSIARYLGAGDSHVKNIKEKHVVSFEELNVNYFEESGQSKMHNLNITDRLSGFMEVHQGLSKEEAVHDANRCFHCGVCTMCDNCYVFCPDATVSRKGDDQWGYDIDFTFCKGCGICSYECPRCAMIMEEE